LVFVVGNKILVTSIILKNPRIVQMMPIK